MADPEVALDLMAREELGLIPEDLGSPIAVALELLRLLRASGRHSRCCPTSCWMGRAAMICALLLAAAALAALGAITARLSGRSAMRGILRAVGDRRARHRRDLPDRPGGWLGHPVTLPGQRIPARLPRPSPIPTAGDYQAWLRRPGGSSYERRRAHVRRYAFAVPTEAALTTIARYAPIVELGAGTGYWAYLLRQRGVDVVAYDRFPPDRAENPNRLDPRLWTEVLAGDESVLARFPDRGLLLCWPSWRDPFAAAALDVYPGATLIYIGEAAGGHTADDALLPAARP